MTTRQGFIGGIAGGLLVWWLALPSPSIGFIVLILTLIAIASGLVYHRLRVKDAGDGLALGMIVTHDALFLIQMAVRLIH